jgi:P27 family predicted phage terminase small subunit
MIGVETLNQSVCAPPEPDWGLFFADELTQSTAKASWSEIIADMRDAGTLAPVNGHAIRRLIQFRIEYDNAAALVSEDGKVIRAKRSATPQISPQWTCMKQASQEVSELEAELGLSPRRRSSASKVQRGKKRETAADKYLGGNVTALRSHNKLG